MRSISIVRGRNYGWPEASYGSHYNGGAIPDDHRGQGFEEPKIWWNAVHLAQLAADLFGRPVPQWKGDALIGALSGEALVRVDIDGDQCAQGRSMGRWAHASAQSTRGRTATVYLLEDGPRARLLKLTPAS